MGMQDCKRHPNNGGLSGNLPKLLVRTLSRFYPCGRTLARVSPRAGAASPGEQHVQHVPVLQAGDNAGIAANYVLVSAGVVWGAGGVGAGPDARV